MRSFIDLVHILIEPNEHKVYFVHQAEYSNSKEYGCSFIYDNRIDAIKCLGNLGLKRSIVEPLLNSKKKFACIKLNESIFE